MRKDMGKFRGRDISTQKWVYGYLVVEPAVYGTHTYICCSEYESNDWDDTVFKKYQVHPSTVGEYTGQKDENKEELYEGDKVLWKGKEWEIRSNEDYCGYEISRSLYTHGENAQNWFMCDIACRCKKVGTVHDTL